MKWNFNVFLVNKMWCGVFFKEMYRLLYIKFICCLCCLCDACWDAPCFTPFLFAFRSEVSPNLLFLFFLHLLSCVIVVQSLSVIKLIAPCLSSISAVFVVILYRYLLLLFCYLSLLFIYFMFYICCNFFFFSRSLFKPGLFTERPRKEEFGTFLREPKFSEKKTKKEE